SDLPSADPHDGQGSRTDTSRQPTSPAGRSGSGRPGLSLPWRRGGACCEVNGVHPSQPVRGPKRALVGQGRPPGSRTDEPVARRQAARPTNLSSPESAEPTIGPAPGSGSSGQRTFLAQSPAGECIQQDGGEVHAGGGDDKEMEELVVAEHPGGGVRPPAHVR